MKLDFAGGFTLQDETGKSDAEERGRICREKVQPGGGKIQRHQHMAGPPCVGLL